MGNIKSKWLKLLIRCILNLKAKSEKEYTQRMHQNLKMDIKTNTEDRGEINLILLRDSYTTKSTIGKLFLNGEMFCDTLELAWKDNQTSISSIPLGSYAARLRLAAESGSRDYMHLLVKDVPDRKYILFHIGNTPKDTRGCILVGMKRGKDRIYESTIAMQLLIKEIQNLGNKKINLIIKQK